MELILLETVKNLGPLGKKIKVRPGYARNYLLPKKKAVLATPVNIKYFEERKEELHKKELERIEQSKQRASSLNGMQVELAVLASEEGKLYGSVGVADIQEAIAAAGGNIQKQEIQLPHGAIKELGVYEVKLGLNHGEIEAVVTVTVVAKK